MNSEGTNHHHSMCPRNLSSVLLYLPSSSSDLAFLKGWKERLQFMDSDFQFIEPVLSLRSSVLHALMNLTAAEVQRDPNPAIAMRRRVEGIFSSLTETLFTQARLAREAGSYDVRKCEVYSCVKFKYSL